MQPYPDVDTYLGDSTQWPQEVSALRRILIDCDLDESIKWGKPCYGADGHNIAIVQEMSRFCALMFFKGALIDDRHGLLTAQGPNSRSAKRLEFTSVAQVDAAAGAIADYVDQAIAIEAAGLDVGPAPEPELAEELAERLASDGDFAVGWESLTPGRRREYQLNISSAKKAETRRSRVEKFAPRIIDGKGLRDR